MATTVKAQEFIINSSSLAWYFKVSSFFLVITTLSLKIDITDHSTDIVGFFFSHILYKFELNGWKFYWITS